MQSGEAPRIEVHVLHRDLIGPGRWRTAGTQEDHRGRRAEDPDGWIVREAPPTVA
ncbi:MAG: hypothetical protein RXS42_08110 [Nitrososphaeria archaeon]